VGAPVCYRKKDVPPRTDFLLGITHPWPDRWVQHCRIYWAWL